MGEKRRRAEAGYVPPKPRPLPFRSLAEAWALAAQIIPPEAPEIQRVQMRKAFFMGAGAFFDMMMHNLDPGQDPTDEDMQTMDRLAAELEAFRQEQIAAVRPTTGPTH